jgi:hypothetical protein
MRLCAMQKSRMWLMWLLRKLSNCIGIAARRRLSQFPRKIPRPYPCIQDTATDGRNKNFVTIEPR